MEGTINRRHITIFAVPSLIACLTIIAGICHGVTASVVFPTQNQPPNDAAALKLQADAASADGLDLLRRDDLQSALVKFTDGLALCRRAGYRYGEGSALSNTGHAYIEMARYDLALQFLRESLAVQREYLDFRGEGHIRTHVSSVCINSPFAACRINS